ncbi:MAG: CCA tRNA nucleotidyltransferase, partial [Clostridia bacterium]|nr:CCA tRNA nucleotidyltransferase [Clostridia bacterium]
MQIEVPKWLKEIAEHNETPLYLVGGYVRNALCGLPPSDVDVAGKAMPEELNLPKGFFYATRYKRMGTALVKHRYIPRLEAEYTPFRTEEYAPGGGHTPTVVRFDADIKEDASRRDFTVNSIYYDIKNDEIIDFFGGVEDAKNKILRAHNPEKVFASDGLRLLRLIRIAAETGFEIDPETARVAKASAHMLADITMNRKSSELFKILFADLAYDVEDAHYRGLTLLRDYGFL